MNVAIPDNHGSRQWFALRVKSRCEKLVSAAVREKGFEEFLPLYQRRNRWSDRFQSVALPLFPGYLFCRIDPLVRLPILTIPGALRFVGIGKTPVPIGDSEIASVQLAVRSGLSAEPAAYLNVGQRVRLEHGPLAGLEGILTEIRSQFRVIVSINLLQRSVSVEVERHWLTPLAVKRPPAYTRALAS